MKQTQTPTALQNHFETFVFALLINNCGEVAYQNLITCRCDGIRSSLLNLQAFATYLNSINPTTCYLFFYNPWYHFLRLRRRRFINRNDFITIVNKYWEFYGITVVFMKSQYIFGQPMAMIVGLCSKQKINWRPNFWGEFEVETHALLILLPFWWGEYC